MSTAKLNPCLTEPSAQKAVISVPGTAPSEDVRYLQKNELALWDAFVDASPQASVFARSWWLDAVGSDTRVLACFKNGRITAGIPLHFEKYYGITVCRMPKLTPRWGVLLPPRKGKAATVAATESGLLTTMAKALQKEKFFFQLFSTELDNWLPFRWQGFSQTTRYTYQTSVQDIDQAWQNMTHNVRNQIGCAKRLGITVAPCSPEQLFELEEETYRRQGLRMPHTLEYMKGLVSAAQEQNSGECLAAIDPEGKVHGASFYVWDSQTTSALILGINSELRTSGAASLLHWSMMQSAAQKSKVYDFCGSVVEGIERFVRSFGGTRVPYHQISRFPRLAGAYLSLMGKI
jgi:lipid II:glycine glycyltransferase (peptidoglycan interpeptide bridge formation enzyme)